MAFHLGRFKSIYIAISSHLYFNVIISPLPFPFFLLYASPLLFLGSLDQTRWESSHGMGLSPPWEVWLAESSQGHHQCVHLLQVPVLCPTIQPNGTKPFSETCPPVGFQSSFPFPLPLQRHIRLSGCECLILSPVVTPTEPTLLTKITPARSSSAHPRLWDLFFISSCSPLSPPVRPNGLAADPVALLAFLQRIISSGCCVSGV